jgi:hypothetical protein
MSEHRQAEKITRREAVRLVATLLGGAGLVGSRALLAMDKPPRNASKEARTPLFSDVDVILLSEVAETILPETDTPGARAAGVGPFMALMVTDCYSPENRQHFLAGMNTLEVASREQFGSGFLGATPDQRLQMLEAFDREQKAYMDSKAPDAPTHWFRMVKELTLLGYFTSEIGYTQAMRYRETPGRYDPCVPLEPGGKTWAAHA